MAPDILLVEDEEWTIRRLSLALEETPVDATLHVVTDGVEAFDFLQGRGEHASAPRPDLVLLDLGLPHRSGMDLLGEIKSLPDLQSIPVVVLSGSDDPSDVEEAYGRGANAYLVKADDFEDTVEQLRALAEFWFDRARLPTGRAVDGPAPSAGDGS